MEISQLSEEEIIKIISDDIIGYQVGHEEYEEAVKGLLDLYKQEKDRNIELATTIDALNTDLKQEKEKREIAEENHKVLSLDLGKALKELGLYEDTIIADELVLEINKKYISKDKIKAKIEEAENKLVEKRKEKYRTIYEIALEYYIEAYKELLEE